MMRYESNTRIALFPSSLADHIARGFACAQTTDAVSSYHSLITQSVAVETPLTM